MRNQHAREQAETQDAYGPAARLRRTTGSLATVTALPFEPRKSRSTGAIAASGIVGRAPSGAVGRAPSTSIVAVPRASVPVLRKPSLPPPPRRPSYHVEAAPSGPHLEARRERRSYAEPRERDSYAEPRERDSWVRPQHMSSSAFDVASDDRESAIRPRRAYYESEQDFATSVPAESFIDHREVARTSYADEHWPAPQDSSHDLAHDMSTSRPVPHWRVSAPSNDTAHETVLDGTKTEPLRRNRTWLEQSIRYLRKPGRGPWFGAAVTLVVLGLLVSTLAATVTFHAGARDAMRRAAMGAPPPVVTEPAPAPLPVAVPSAPVEVATAATTTPAPPLPPHLTPPPLKRRASATPRTPTPPPAPAPAPTMESKEKPVAKKSVESTLAELGEAQLRATKERP